MLLEFQRDFAAEISGPAEGPMRVYRNTVLSGCVDALRANYPVVARLLGEEMFETIAAEYASIFPPRRPVMAVYGERFPDWLEKQPWIWDIAYVPDVARIERLQIEALFAADAEPLAMDAIRSSEDWLGLRLSLHPATRFHWLSMPAMTIWLAQRDGHDGDLDIEWQAEGVLMTRPTMKLLATRLSRAGHRFLFGIRLGETVGEAAVTVATLYPDTDIGSLFTCLVNSGAFAAQPDRS